MSNNKLKLIPKKYPGGFLNPVNWFLNTYDDTEFSSAFAKARNNGDKQFKWKGKIYNTQLISKKGQEEYTNSLKFIKNIIDQIKPEHINHSWYEKYAYFQKPEIQHKMDSLENAKKLAEVNFFQASDQWDNTVMGVSDKKFHSYADQEAYLDSLTKAQDYYDKEYNRLDDEYNEYLLQDDNLYTKLFIEDLYKKLDNFKPIVTTQPDKSYNFAGYYRPKDNKVYINLNSPGTAVHEISHYLGLDNLQSKTKDVPYTDKDVTYYLNSDEIEAREWQRKYLNWLKGVNGPEDLSKMSEKQLSTYLNIPQWMLGNYNKLIYNSDNENTLDSLRQNYFNKTIPIYYNNK